MSEHSVHQSEQGVHPLGEAVLSAIASDGLSPGRRRLQLSEEVASYLREIILSGQVRPGQFIRLEPIAEKLGVSNTPVREGLLALRGEGLVQLLPRRGFVVAEFSRQDVKDLFWVQATIAGELAARAAARITAEELAELESTQGEHAQAVKDDDAAAIERLGHRFHRLVNLAARSQRLALLLGTVVRYLPNRFYAGFTDQVDATLNDHPNLIAALRNSDAESARNLMRTHILEAGELVLQNLTEHGMFADDAGR